MRRVRWKVMVTPPPSFRTEPFRISTSFAMSSPPCRDRPAGAQGVTGPRDRLRKAASSLTISGTLGNVRDKSRARSSMSVAEPDLVDAPNLDLELTTLIERGE